jgi:Spy/CpxP family protein refolding chaperone
MRKFTTSVIVAALSLATPAFVQAQGAAAPSEAQTPAAKSNTTIRSIKVVDLNELQPEMRSQVEAFALRSKEEDMTSLRKSLDALPQAASALKEKGLSSAQVVAINIDDGVLTMFAKSA